MLEYYLELLNNTQLIQSQYLLLYEYNQYEQNHNLNNNQQINQLQF